MGYNDAMRYFTLFATLIALLPTISHAAGLNELITGFVGFLSTVVIPFLFAVAFLVFAVNVIRYFVLGGATDEGRENAKNLAIYSVSAFVILIIFWGLVNLITSSLGFDGVNQPTPDYKDPSSVKNSGIKQSAPPATTDSTSGTNAPVNVLPPNTTNPAPTTNTQPGTTNPTTPSRPGTVPIDDSLPGSPCDSGAAFDTQGRPCGIY